MQDKAKETLSRNAIKILYSKKLTESYKGDTLISLLLLGLVGLIYPLFFKDGGLSVIEIIIIFLIVAYALFSLYTAFQIYTRYKTMDHFLRVDELEGAKYLVRFRVLKDGKKVEDWRVPLDKTESIKLDPMRDMGNYLKLYYRSSSSVREVTVMNDLVYPYTRYIAQELASTFGLRVSDLVVGEEITPEEYGYPHLRDNPLLDVPELEISVRDLERLIESLKEAQEHNPRAITEIKVKKVKDDCLEAKFSLKPSSMDSLIIAVLSSIAVLILAYLILQEIASSFHILYLGAFKWVNILIFIVMAYLSGLAVHHYLAYIDEHTSLRIKCTSKNLILYRSAFLRRDRILVLEQGAFVRLIEDADERYYLVGRFNSRDRGVFEIGLLDESEGAFLNKILEFYFQVGGERFGSRGEANGESK